MTFTHRALVALVAITLSPALLPAQSLTDLAKKTADDRAARKAADKKAGIVTPAAKVHTNQDLQTINAPAPTELATAPADAPSVLPGTAVSKPVPPTAVEIRDAEQKRDLQMIHAKATLVQLQQALRAGEIGFTDLRRSYANMCGDPHGGDLIRTCVDLDYDIRFTTPRKLDELRSNIGNLTHAIDVEAAARAR